MGAPTLPALRDYAGWWLAVTPESLPALRDVVHADVRFKDPFNDVRGVDALETIVRHMLTTVREPRFAVLDMAVGARAGYLRWRFSGQRQRNGRLRGAPFQIEGMSEILADADGRITAHVDHWDAATQVYEGVPLLGTLLRFAKRKAGGG